MMTRAMPVILACLAMLGGSVSTMASEPSVTRYALVVGQNRGSSDTQLLKFALRDAEKIAGLLTSLGGVAPEEVVLLLSPTADAFRQGLQSIDRRIRESRAEFTELFIYYSGHADDRGFQLGDEILPTQEIQTYLEQVAATVTVVIVDACHSGAFVREKGGKRVPALDASWGSGGQTEGYAIITSSSADEKSQESDELRGSFFTHFLVSGMRGDADVSGDGRVTLHELYQYAYDKTLKRSYSSGSGEQHPSFDYAVTGTGQFVISFPKQSTSRLILPEEMTGNILLYYPETDTVLAEIEKKAGAATIVAVPAGTLELFRRGEDSLYRITLEVPPGGEIVAPNDGMSRVSRTYLIDKGASPAVVLGAKGGYQFFWDGAIRERSLLPTILGGVEVRVTNWLSDWASPFAELLVGGAVASSKGGGLGPLAQSTSSFQAGAGIALQLLDAPFGIEFVPAASLFYVRRTVAVDNLEFEETMTDSYLSASPSVSLVLSMEIIRSLSVTVQAKAGYLYFREDDQGKNLGFTEFYVGALWRL